jgi:hypothetical protein
MTEIVEIMARAICAADGKEWREGTFRAGGITYDADQLNNIHRHEAQAALSALREHYAVVPREATEGMMHAYHDLAAECRLKDIPALSAVLERVIAAAEREV